MSRARATAEITPRDDADGCDFEGCSATTLLAEIDPKGATEAQTLCPIHRVEFLREVTNQ